MTGARGAALALVSGLLFALAFPGPGLWPLALIAYVPLLFALDGASLRRAIWLGWLAHALINLLGFRFLWVPLREIGALPWTLAALAMVILAALQGLRGAVLGGLTALGGRALPLPSAFLLAHLLSEHIPLLFPWSFSAFLHPIPPLVQSASLGGAPLVALWLAVGNVLVATLLARWLGKPWPMRWAWASALGVGLAWGWGQRHYTRQIEREESEETWTIGLLHGAIPLAPDQPPEVEGWLEMTRAIQEAERRSPRLFLLPETILPFPARRANLAQDVEAQWSASTKIPVIAGALAEGPEGATNSALLRTPDQHLIVANKRVLLPFGEYIPLEGWFPWLRQFSPRTARLAVLPPDPPFQWEGHTLGVSICYEGMLPERVREGAFQGQAHLLLNLTNDAWFPGTQEPWLHLVQTQLRAVEMGRYLARATNQGVSVVVAPSGRIVEQAFGAPTRPLLARVNWRNERTPFARWGERVAWGVAVGMVVLLGRRTPRGSRARGGWIGTPRKKDKARILGGGTFSAKHPK